MDDGRVTLMVELWFEAEPQLDPDALVAALPGTDRMPSDGPVLVAHPQFVHHYEDREQCIITAALYPDAGATNGDRPDTTQTWDWPEAGDVLARCRHQLLIAEFAGRAHPHKDRLEAYLPTLRAAVELTRPAAAVCPTSDRVVRPHELLEDELAPFVNVRLFRVSDDDSTLMDTLGLHALGLPDVQCRFDHARHSPESIGVMLYDLAAFLVDRGDVIADGDTVGDLPWRCHTGEALVEPERRVLDLTPA
jgi:hypothetical protein